MQAVSIEIPFDKSGKIDVIKQKEIISKYEYVLELRKNIINYKQKLHKLNVSIASLIADGTNVDKNISTILNSPSTNSGLKKLDVSLEQNTKDVLPVYSATMDEDAVFGYVAESSKWKKYENVLTWNKDGSAGFVFYRKNRFVPYEKVKLLEIKKEHKADLSYEYLKHVIQNRLFEEGFGFSIKCSMDKVLKLSIPIPTKSNGHFNLSKQIEIAKIYDKIEEIKKSVLIELDKVSNADISFD